jgi:hypothetical protein
MPLPKIDAPIFALNLPSTEKEIRYRPFLVKEQKLLLIALESDDQKATFNAIKQIINNCTIDEVDVDKMPIFDLEYTFLKIRAKSIGEIVELNLRHPTGFNSKGEVCQHSSPVKFNLMEVEVQRTLGHEEKIILDEEKQIGVKFKYPDGSMASKVAEDVQNNEIDLATEAMFNCVDYIFDKDNVYKKEDSTREELVEFFQNLSQEQFQKLSAFFDTMPKLKHELKWKCLGCGCEDKFTLEGLGNFFG